MRKRKWVENMKLGGIFFVVYLVTIVVVSILTSLMTVYLDLRLPTYLTSFITILIGITLASFLLRRYAPFNIATVVLYATLFYLAVQIFFQVRDFMITNINGVPLVRDHIGSISRKIITVIFFYFAGRVILQQIAGKKTK